MVWTINTVWPLNSFLHVKLTKSNKSWLRLVHEKAHFLPSYIPDVHCLYGVCMGERLWDKKFPSALSTRKHRYWCLDLLVWIQCFILHAHAPTHPTHHRCKGTFGLGRVMTFLPEKCQLIHFSCLVLVLIILAFAWTISVFPAKVGGTATPLPTPSQLIRLWYSLSTPSANRGRLAGHSFLLATKAWDS